MSYSNGIQQTYFFGAFAGVSAIGQSPDKIAGPDGLTGRMVAMNAVTNVATTSAASSFTLRNNVTTTEIYARMAVPVTAIELAVGPFTIDDDDAVPVDTPRIPAGAVLELDGDGLAVAGNLDVWVTIEWS